MFLGARRLGAVGSVASLRRFVRPRELLVGKDSVFVRFGRRFISGAVLERVHQSRAALQNAISMLEAGANPDTGQLFSSDQYAEFSRTISELQPLVNAYESYEECAVEIEGLRLATESASECGLDHADLRL